MAKNLNLKELNARVEQLAGHFEKGFNELKAAVNDDTASSEFQVSFKRELNNKLLQFEQSTRTSLREIKSDIDRLSNEVDNIKKKLSKFYVNKNNNTFVIHGMEEKNSDVYDDIIQLFAKNMNVEVKKHDIIHCYRLGQKKDNKKCRPIVVEFVYRWIRDQLFYSKKKLKGSKIIITEMLTADVLALFKEVRAIMGNSAWSQGGTVFVLLNGKKTAVRSEDEWSEMKNDIEVAVK